MLSRIAPWLLSAKVDVPLPVDAYFRRPRLFERDEPARSRVVVIQAPGGFGKTTVLAEMYRHARERGVLAGWLTLDEDDTEDGIGTYLAYAFERAGLRIPNPDDALHHGLTLLRPESKRTMGRACLSLTTRSESRTALSRQSIPFCAIDRAISALRWGCGRIRVWTWRESHSMGEMSF